NQTFRLFLEKYLSRAFFLVLRSSGHGRQDWHLQLRDSRAGKWHHQATELIRHTVSQWKLHQLC
ncbi:unnamed protein product, partial [Ixodes persulcatus]